MFGKWRNNYYYGKSGQGDFRRDDLPHNRWELFWAMLRTRLAGLCRLNLTVAAVWLPLIVVVVMFISSVLTLTHDLGQSCDIYDAYIQNPSAPLPEGVTIDAINQFGEELNGQTTAEYFSDRFDEQIVFYCVLLIPCIAITGPVQAGLAYVCRNWSRDEHAFAWSDFKDAVKANWKQGLLISAITSIMPLVCYTSYTTYGGLANTQGILFMIPQMMVLIMVIIWMLGLVFAYPIIVGYEVKNMALIKNMLTLAIARLPFAVGIRLLTLVPALIAIAVFYFTGTPIALLVLGAYYILIGFCLVRFIHASYANGVFDKYINSRLEGVQVNRGLAVEEDDEDDEAEETLSE